VFNRKRRKRRLKKSVKRFLIIGVPILTLVGMLGMSANYLSKASESTFNPGKYYENSPENSENSNPGTEEGDIDVTYPEVSQVITNHDNIILDTDPNSMTVLVNKELSLPTDYVPTDLVVPNVLFSFDYYDEKKLMRKEAAKALEDLFAAASSDGLELSGVSAYRSYERQYEIFTNNVKVKGLDHTTKYSAIPGYSEHQTGLSIDVSTKDCNNRIDATFADTTESEWLIQNAHLYGYIIRYANDKTAITGYSYEPWHIRYVGKALATYLYENNLCLEEYYNHIPSTDYTNAISYDNLESYGIDPEDVKVPTKAPTKIPTLTPTPTPTPTLEPTKIPTPTPTKKPEVTEIVTPTISPTPGIDNGEIPGGDGNTDDDEVTVPPEQTDEYDGTGDMIVYPTPTMPIS
jgi:D-alanyl-D-alanine carboxypeptidase